MEGRGGEKRAGNNSPAGEMRGGKGGREGREGREAGRAGNSSPAGEMRR